MIERNLATTLRARANQHPVVAVTGPRQSGKTTLCQAVFPDHPYVSLEAEDVRQYAKVDPRGFLGEYGDGAVLDEVQRAPHLLSFLQGLVDENPTPGQFILTGSQHFGLSEVISQSFPGLVPMPASAITLPGRGYRFWKQQIKAPKLHFLDSGLVCFLLGIRTPEELQHHPLKGPIFESWVVSEVFKRRVHLGLEPRLFHYREAQGLEVDLVLDLGPLKILGEVNAGATVNQDFFRNLQRLRDALNQGESGGSVVPRLIYGGDHRQRRSDIDVVPWNGITDLAWE